MTIDPFDELTDKSYSDSTNKCWYNVAGGNFDRLEYINMERNVVSELSYIALVCFT